MATRLPLVRVGGRIQQLPAGDSLPSSAGVLAPSLATNFFTSRTWTAPQDGIVVVRAMGAGGGGARGSNATGGYYGSWGAKAVRVVKGANVVVSIGAGGAGRSASDGNGTAGGDTTVTVNGVTYTAYGGPGGLFNSGSAPGNGPSPSSNWDFGAASVKPGWAAGTVRTGGAGVDVTAQGGNATTSASVDGSGGGGTGGASVNYTGGGAIGVASAYGQQTTSSAGIFADASGGEWGISFFGGAGGQGLGVTQAGNGGGGGGTAASATAANSGVNGGGGGSNSSTGGGGDGGLGAGGGATAGGNGGNGGKGYAHLKFYADTGV